MTIPPTVLTPEQHRLLNRAFRPHSPIEDASSFVGRSTELNSVRTAIYSSGLQVVIFGEAGAGKTSLANISTDGLDPIYIFCPKDSSFESIISDIIVRLVDKFGSSANFTFDTSTNKLINNNVTFDIASINVNTFARLIDRSVELCIVLDEVDRIADNNVVEKLAEFAKGISTTRPSITLIFVGVADNADALLKGHGSNFRNLRQVPISRMARNDLEKIIERGEGILGIKFSESVRNDILEISDSFPYWIHLLATSSAESCLLKEIEEVSDLELTEGLVKAANEAEVSLKQDYIVASRSTHKSTIYQRILSAMSRSSNNSLSVGDVHQEVNRDGSDTASKQSIGQALIALTENPRKRILVNEGDGFYKFRNPLTKGYIKIIERNSV